VPTVLVAANFAFGGVSSLLRAPSSMEAFRALGYPGYFAVLLGTAQLLGVVALLAPVPRLLREWAYAGFAIDTVSAMASLLAVGSPVAHVAFPLFIFALVVASRRAWGRRVEAPASPVGRSAPA